MGERDRPSRTAKILGEALAAVEAAGRAEVGEAPPCCATCAFRPECMTNMMGGTVLTAMKCVLDIDQDDFACHHGMDNGRPTKLCVGYLLAKAAPFEVVKAEFIKARERMASVTGPDEIRTAFDAWIAEVDPQGQMDDYARGRLFLRSRLAGRAALAEAEASR